jgi:hypothetical protein
MLYANTEGLFRIIQSIPSSTAEPFKRWLAKVGYERIQEIEDPEPATKRTGVLPKAEKRRSNNLRVSAQEGREIHMVGRMNRMRTGLQNSELRMNVDEREKYHGDAEVTVPAWVCEKTLIIGW